MLKKSHIKVIDKYLVITVEKTVPISKHFIPCVMKPEIARLLLRNLKI